MAGKIIIYFLFVFFFGCNDSSATSEHKPKTEKPLSTPLTEHKPKTEPTSATPSVPNLVISTKRTAEPPTEPKQTTPSVPNLVISTKRTAEPPTEPKQTTPSAPNPAPNPLPDPVLADKKKQDKKVAPQAEQKPVCSFPSILKQAVEQSLNKKCLAITNQDLSTIKELKISYPPPTSSLYAPVFKGFEYSSYFSSLESIDMSNNPQMQSIPNFVFAFNQLKSLDISKTKIQNLGPEFCELKNLTTLKASHNHYEGNEMPLSIVCLSELKTLDLSYSSLQYIDEYIFYLKKLEQLNLRGNHLMNLPAMLALLPSLVTLDLRDNWFEYQSVNSLHDCSHLEKDSSGRKDCQQEMLEDIQCEYWYEIPEDCSHIESADTKQKEKCEKAQFKRGKLGNQSFIKRYEEMTGEKHAERYEGDEGHLKARCYYFWINQYVFYNNPDDPKTDPEFEFLNLKYHNHPNKHYIVLEKLTQKQQYLLDLTINGKTIRELRLLMDEITKNSGAFFSLSLGRYTGCQFHMKGISIRDTQEVIKEDWNIKTTIPNIVRFLYHGVTDLLSSVYHFWIWPQSTNYGPSHYETHIERHRAPDWNERPLKNKAELCLPIDWSTPIPSGPLGPWSEALPAVQALIQEKYLEPRWNECENWPTGQCYDWEARMDRGENPGGFKKDHFAKKIEERNKQRRKEN